MAIGNSLIWSCSLIGKVNFLFLRGEDNMKLGMAERIHGSSSNLRSTLPVHQNVFRIEKSISLETHSFCADTRPKFLGKAILVKRTLPMGTYALGMKSGNVIFDNFGSPAEPFLRTIIHCWNLIHINFKLSSCPPDTPKISWTHIIYTHSFQNNTCNKWTITFGTVSSTMTSVWRKNVRHFLPISAHGSFWFKWLSQSFHSFVCISEMHVEIFS